MREKMKELHEAIEKYGQGIGTDIVKVDMFLNHRIDVKLATEIGKAFYEEFKSKRVDCILTIEASGIAAAITTAQAFGNIPVVFAKKEKTTNVSSDAYTSKVYSYTHHQENQIRVSKRYLEENSHILVIDDFLANGEAMNGLIDVVKQAKGHLVGVGACIEKGFQPGGDRLREEGIHVKSLAIVDAIENGKIILRK